MHQQRAANATGSGILGLGRPYVPPLIRGLDEWQKCEAEVLELVGLCEDFTQFKAAGINEKLWFALLDALVAQQHKFSNKDGNSRPSLTKFASEICA